MLHDNTKNGCIGDYLREGHLQKFNNFCAKQKTAFIKFDVIPSALNLPSDSLPALIYIPQLLKGTANLTNYLSYSIVDLL